ncbi:MAG: LPS biosynthesis protein [Ruminococcaceae bacterium]|nr:LPS biosynthesis protein [Oscillospiraceae bacterium]
MRNVHIKHLIIGAGISGLTFANYCKGDYLIVEKENEVGGYCRTIKKGEYVWDYAGHFFHFNTEEFKSKFLDKMPAEDIIYNDKCTKIVHGDRFIDFPFQTNIHQLPKEEFIDCLYDLFNKEEKENYDNFLDMLYGKFGKSIVEKFLKPYNEKLYAIDLKELDVDAMGRFFPYADKEAIIRNMKNSTVNSYNASFLYPKNGAGSFIEILYNALDKEKVLLNTEVKSIDFNAKTATLSNGDTVEYDYLINTIPLNKFLELPGGYSELIDEMSYNKVLVFNLGFNKRSELCTKEHWLYVADKECNFYRCGFYNNILGAENLSMYIEIGYSKKTKITKADIDEQLKLTLENLKKLGITDNETELVEYCSIIMDPAYVHINTETNKKLDELKNSLGQQNVYTIGRYGAWIYNSMEDSMLKAKELAEKIG